MGNRRAACRGDGRTKRRPRRSYPEETERFLYLLAGPRCRKPVRDRHGKTAHYCTTVNFTKTIRSHPNDALCLCCRYSRKRISEKVWRTRSSGAFIGVSVSRLELEVRKYTRKDGGRFPVNRFLRSNALVETFQALWCELDRGSPKEQRDRLRAFGVFPTMIVRSGGKSRHAYWVLAEPVTRDRFNEVMPRLCAQLLGDGKTIPAMHQLRLPGSVHAKSLERGRLRRARLIHDEERFPTIGEIEAALTLAPEEVTAYMDEELGRRRRSGRAASGNGAGEAVGQAAREDGSGVGIPGSKEIEEAELRAFDDGGNDAILDAAHGVFGDLRRDRRHATTLAMIRWCKWSMGLPEPDTRRIVKQFIRRWPGTSEGANERPEEVTRQVDALVANWYGKARAPEVEYASITDLEDCVYETARSLPPEWPPADACGFHDWLTGFVRYLTAIAHRRGLTCFRRHSLHAKKDIERLGRVGCEKRVLGRKAHDCRERGSRNRKTPDDRIACSQGLTRDGRRMAFRAFKLLLSTGFVVQVEQYLPEKRTRLYDISIPILSPDVWRRHRHETTAEWSAHAAKRAAQDADGGVLSQRRRSSEQA